MALTKVTEGIRTLGTGEVLSANIGTGEVATANMAVDPTNASNLSSGSVPLAQLGLAPSTNVTGLQNDIATLALHSATQNNQAAYNLSNAFVDQYEDSTGIGVLTDVLRNTAGEYLSSVSTATASSVLTTNDTGWLYAAGADLVSDVHTNWTAEGWVYCTSPTQVYQFVLGSAADFYGLNVAMTANPGTATSAWFGDGSGPWTYSPTAISWATAGIVINTWIHWALVQQGNDYKIYWGGAERFSTTGITVVDHSSDTLYFGYQQPVAAYRLYGHMTGIRISSVARYTSAFTPSTTAFTSDADTELLINSNTTNGSTTFTDSGPNGITISTGGTGMENSTDVASPLTHIVTNATGNYTSTTETASATVSKMGIVVLYKDEAGTATLDTDLVAQVSADGGANYVSAPLTAGGTFSTGINIAKSNDITISNTGTAPKYKISFANQVLASKETQVHGVALLY